MRIKIIKKDTDMDNMVGLVDKDIFKKCKYTSYVDTDRENFSQVC